MNNPWFEYNESDGKYHRFQYGGKHNGDGGQIAVNNVIFQYVEWGHYASTDYLNITFTRVERVMYLRRKVRSCVLEEGRGLRTDPLL